MLQSIFSAMLRLLGICSAWAAPVIHTDGGILQGRRDGAADVFLGLRYARAKRFEVAELESLGSETIDATEQGPKCWNLGLGICVSSCQSCLLFLNHFLLVI